MKLVRLLTLTLGFLLLMSPAPSFQLGACYSTTNIAQETECSACCANEPTVDVATDGSGSGAMDFGSATVNCGGEASPGSCYPSNGNDACPTNGSYQTWITNVSCGGGGGSSCSRDSDCATPYVCEGDGTCGICADNYQACSSDGDCCSANCTVFNICGLPRW